MDTNVFIAVSIIWCIAAITPGPNFFITVHTAIGETRRLSLFTVLGIVTGTFAWTLSGYMGVSIIFKSVPILYYTLKLVGGLYLVFIGVNLIIRKKMDRIPRQNRNPLSAVNCFRLGMLTNLLNPKTAAFITSLFAATIPPDATAKTGFICILLICSISAIWYSFVAALFSLDFPQRRYNNYKRAIERVAGSIFILFGVKLAVSK